MKLLNEVQDKLDSRLQFHHLLEIKNGKKMCQSWKWQKDATMMKGSHDLESRKWQSDGYIVEVNE